VQVGPAYPGGVDVDQDVEWTLDGWLVDVVDRGWFLVLVDSDRLHDDPSRQCDSFARTMVVPSRLVGKDVLSQGDKATSTCYDERREAIT
jgi:hypothetical protein